MNAPVVRLAASLWFLLAAGTASAASASTLEDVWTNPPSSARLRAYWWWLNSNVTKEAITRDLEQMKAKGFGGALICDAGGAEQRNNAQVPRGPTFFSAGWRELYRHALREADRLGLEMSLNIQSGWNLGGPIVTPDDAPKKLTWSEVRVLGPAKVVVPIAAPKSRDNYYRDLFVIAWRVRPDLPAKRAPLQNQLEKALLKPLRPFSAPDTTPLFQEVAATPGEQDLQTGDVLDLTGKLDATGQLTWDAPAGEWQVLRLGCTLNDHCKVSTCSQGWEGYALDPFDDGAFRRYWDAVVAPLIADAGPLAGKALKYLHTDSWEVEVANWTPTLREEFKARRGYDLLPWLPVIAGRIVNSRNESNRFLADFRRTMGDLAIANHYRLFREGAHRHGLLIHPESGGPHAVPIDAQQCLGYNDAPMSEFWATSWKHRIGDENRFFLKQPASAAHTYGRKLVLAEGFTTIGPHWQETLWDNLKPSFDKAICEGLNLLVWHAFVCSPKEMGLPGQQYFAGTHLNPNVTWWEKSAPFFAYLNRCQALMQQGLFVADVAYYYGDHVPNFAQLKKSDPAKILPGYDYDVLTEEVLLTRAAARGGRLVLPDGMSYRVLVLPNRPIVSLPVLRKIRDLVAAGATVIGPRPTEASGLHDRVARDAEVQRLAAELWETGKVIAGRPVREVLQAAGVPPDCEFSGAPADANLDYVHRRTEEADIYFVANRHNRAGRVTATFRVSGRVPELWNAVTGERRPASAYEVREGRTAVPLEFDPCGSWFVIFRPATGTRPAAGRGNFPRFAAEAELTGAWQVRFDPRWGGPATAEFPSLVSWPTRTEPGIKYYSGTAVYEKRFDLPASLRAKLPSTRVWLDLGQVRELAEVKVNGRSCGIVWAPPFRVDVTDALRPTGNVLEVEVVNFWPNRVIGDAALPEAQRLTKTNVLELTAKTPLIDSGLLGPVRLETRRDGE
ncbi:MAG: glycoside hydrolase [Verrucomicrobia bacterium]|nr:glycoside hydrolase [Verrucomicrobiota bacterium]